MNKIELFLSAQEKDLEFERNQIQEDIERTQKQIDELRMKIKELQESKDRSYEVFSASQAGYKEDTEISAMEQLVSDKIRLLGDLQINLAEAEKKLAQIVELDYHYCGYEFDQVKENLIAKLQLIYKWIPVDSHRAQAELLNLIKHLED